MHISIFQLYYLTVILLFFLGIKLFQDSFSNSNIIKAKFRLNRIHKDFLESFADKSSDDAFIKTGIKMSVKKYTAYRNLVAVIILMFAIVKLISGESEQAIKLTLYIAVYMFLTVPKAEIIKGKKSPFVIVTDFIYRRHKDMLDNELVAVISQMCNLIITNKEKATGDYLFTRIIPYTNVSKKIFIQTHAFLMRGRKREAAKYFDEEYCTKLGTCFSQILLKIDTISAIEFLNEFEALLKLVEDEKETSLYKKRQNTKVLIFTLASFQIALILFDYIYIIIADTVRMLVL